MRLLKILIGLGLTGALLACGGGGGNASSAGTGTSTGTSTGTTVAAIDLSSAALQVSPTAGSSVLISAVAKDANNNALAGKSIAWVASAGTLGSIQTATGADNGLATAQLSAVGVAVGKTITVTVTSEGKSASTIVTVTNGGVAATAATVGVTVVNVSGAAVNSISIGGGFSARAVVKDENGNLVPNKLVSFSLSGSAIATLSSTTALTDASGIALVSLAPAAINSLGAATVSASATFGSSTPTGQSDFAVSPSSLSLSAITVGSSSLASGGNTSVQASAIVAGASPGGVSVNVSFSASCGRINGSGTSVSVTTNGSGVASAVYSAVAPDGTLCSGPVTISAASAGASPTSTVINVAVPVANAITFVSANPAQIFVAGTGALEQSLVKFKVLSGATSLPNVSVQFSLTINPGGVGLSATGLTAPVTATSDSNGEVSVSIFSGTIPGPVRVRAALGSNAAVFAESQNLTVASGPPSQRFMSVSVSTFNIEGWLIDGTSTTITARLADRQGNPVDDGTVVNFTSEGGQVATSCATARVNGISLCSVDFISQNFRPGDGRVSVLAFTTGTKDYIDGDGNNSYNAAFDTLVPIGDAYRDDNENGVFDTGEFVITRGGTASCASAGGAGGGYPSRLNTCDSNLATTVRQQVVLMLSSSTAAITLTTPVTAAGFDFNLASIDHPLLPLPAGTSVSGEVIDQTSSNGLSCSVGKVFGSKIPSIAPTSNVNASAATSHSISLKDCAKGDIVSIVVKVPSGLETSFTYTIP